MKAGRGRRFRLPGLLLLIVAFIGMGALLLLDNDNRSNSNAPLLVIPTRPPVISEDLFPDVLPSEINAIRLTDPNARQTLTLERLDDGWVALEYPGQAVDSEVIGGILRTLADLPYQRLFDVPTGASLEQYGFFSDGRYFFSIQFLTIYEEPHIVAIGGPVSDINTPTPNQAFYALVDDLPGMYLIPAGPVFFLVEQLLNPPLG